MAQMKTILFLMAVLFFSNTVDAKTIYLLYEGNCMDRLEYRINDPATGKAYISYQITGDNQATLLEVGTESSRWTGTAPSLMTRCQEATISRRIVQELNVGKTRIYMVRKGEKGFNISPVTKASFYYVMGTEIEYTSKDAEFAMDLERPIYDQDISSFGSDTQIYLDGLDFQQCQKGFIFRKVANGKKKDYKEMTLIPSIGIIEKRSVTFQKNSEKVNIVHLTKVNQTPLESFINTKCDELQAGNFDKRKPEQSSRNADQYSNERSNAKANDYSNNSRRSNDYDNNNSRTNDYANESAKINISPSRVNQGDPCSVESSEGRHVVKKGETLYSIARRYSISLAQLRTWNNLNATNVISPCQALAVLPPASMPTETARSVEPTRKNTRKAERRIDTSLPYWAAGNKFHIAQRSENVAHLAKLYGYTEERFRWMNGLSQYEEIYPGQQLKVTDCNCPPPESGKKSLPQPFSEIDKRINSNRDNGNGFQEKGVNIPDPSQLKVHIVKDFETLFSIAKRYNISVTRLRQLNGMAKGEIIMPSQRLYVE